MRDAIVKGRCGAEVRVFMIDVVKSYSGLVDRISRQVFGSKTTKRMGLLRMQVLVFVLSGFFNNTPIVVCVNCSYNLSTLVAR